MLAFLLLMSAGAVAADFSAALPGQAAPAPPPEEEARAPSDERIVCRSRPRLGSRITLQRSCRSVWAWRVYERDMEQSRRDIADRGARGCGGTGPECQ